MLLSVFSEVAADAHAESHGADDHAHESSAIPLYLGWLVFISILIADKLPPVIPKQVAIFLGGCLSRGLLDIQGEAMHEMIELTFPFLLFGEALSADISSLKRVSKQVVVHTTVGYILMSAFVCGAIYLLLDWPLYSLLALTAVVIGTDNDMGHAILHAFDVSPKLLALVGGESMFSDIVVVALFSTASAAWLEQSKVDTITIVVDFLQLGIGGFSLGIMLGCVCLFIVERTRNKHFQIIGSVVCAVTSYGLGEHLSFSGAVACVCAGLVTKWKVTMALVNKEEFQDTFQTMGIFGDGVCLFLCGVCLVEPFYDDNKTIDLFHMVSTGLIIYVVSYLGRFVSFFAVRPLGNLLGPHVSLGESAIWGFAGSKGKLGIALALAALTKPGVKPAEEDFFLFHASMVVILSHVLNSVILSGLVKRLGFAHGSAVAEIRREIVLKAIHLRQSHSEGHKSRLLTCSVEEASEALRQVFVHLYVRELERRNFEKKASSCLLDAALYALDKQKLMDAQYLIKSLKSESPRRALILELFVEIYEVTRSRLHGQFVQVWLEVRGSEDGGVGESDPLVSGTGESEKIRAAWELIRTEMDDNVAAVTARLADLREEDVKAAKAEIQLRTACAETAERVEEFEDLIGDHATEHLVEELLQKISTFEQLRKLSDEVESDDENDTDDQGTESGSPTFSTQPV